MELERQPREADFEKKYAFAEKENVFLGPIGPLVVALYVCNTIEFQLYLSTITTTNTRELATTHPCSILTLQHCSILTLQLIAQYYAIIAQYYAIIIQLNCLPSNSEFDKPVLHSNSTEYQIESPKFQNIMQ